MGNNSSNNEGLIVLITSINNIIIAGKPNDTPNVKKRGERAPWPYIKKKGTLLVCTHDCKKWGEIKEIK